MKRTINIQIHLVSLAVAIAFVFSSCETTIAEPTSLFTPNEQSLASDNPFAPTSESLDYLHFAPSWLTKIRLEFDYPGSWLFSEDNDGLGIFLGDPRILTLPTLWSDDYHTTPHDFGIIDIWILPSSSGHTADTELASLKESYSNHFRYTVLTDYKTKIDGQDASVLEYQVKERIEGSPTLMFERRIFFEIEDQLYEIYFSVAEKDRGGKFEQGYEYFFKSLKIVP